MIISTFTRRQNLRIRQTTFADILSATKVPLSRAEVLERKNQHVKSIKQQTLLPRENHNRRYTKTKPNGIGDAQYTPANIDYYLL